MYILELIVRVCIFFTINLDLNVFLNFDLTIIESYKYILGNTRKFSTSQYNKINITLFVVEIFDFFLKFY